MVCHAFIIGVVDAFYSLAVNTDGFMRVCYRTLERIGYSASLSKTLTTGFLAITSVLASHHDIALAAQMLFVIGPVFHCTF